MIDQKIFPLSDSIIFSPLTEIKDVASTENGGACSSKNKTISTRTSIRNMRNLLSAPPVLQPMGKYVGELQEKWQFPSDHLPIGMTLDNFDIASWNVLEATQMWWVMENSQGLSRSLIVDEHEYFGGSFFTVRDMHVVKLVREMLTHRSNPRSILALQECSREFIDELRSQLPSFFEIIVAGSKVVIIDKSYFRIKEVKVVKGVFSDAPKRGFQDILIQRRDNGQLLHLINVQLPGDKYFLARFEFAKYIARIFDPSETTIVMGDMNFNEIEMSKALKQAFSNGRSPFSIYSPYCTSIDRDSLESRAIDHFFVYSPLGLPVTLNSPEQIMSELAPTVSLLND